jgi:Lar family restriction alleviation protein
MKTPLKHCPFCGGSPHWFRQTSHTELSNGVMDRHGLECDKCEATVIGPPGDLEESRAVALAIWNQRVTPD